MAHASEDKPNDVMDYAEHDRTYKKFLFGAKWGSIVTCAILIGMALGFFAGFGFIGGTIGAIACVVLAKFLL